MSPRLLLVVAAVLFSTGGAAIKYNQLTSWQVACFRAAFAAGALWIAIPGVRRRWSWTLFWVGCAYASMLVMFVAATKLTTAANAIFLQSTAPIYLLFIGPVVLKEPLRRSDVMLLVLMAIGMSLFFVGSETPLATAPNPRLGNLLGAATGLAWGTHSNRAPLGRTKGSYRRHRDRGRVRRERNRLFCGVDSLVPGRNNFDARCSGRILPRNVSDRTSLLLRFEGRPALIGPGDSGYSSGGARAQSGMGLADPRGAARNPGMPRGRDPAGGDDRQRTLAESDAVSRLQ